ncbi:MAG: DMT family transporter [Clostridiaceae bacterium]|nr:DMT family transporter [Clostridiaceae bacterium]
MFSFLALLSGIVVAVMVVFNGDLTTAYGNYNATFIIHLVGVVFAFIFSKIRGQKVFSREKLPLWLYSAGAIGIFTTLFNNYSFGKISLTGILALTLFGQTVFSLLIDNLGLFGMKKHPLQKSSLIGLLFSLAGIIFMLSDLAGVDSAAVVAIIFSISAGCITVVTRTINARLSGHIGAMPGSFINHLVGLPFTLTLALIIPSNDITAIAQRPSPHVWIYLGGLLGVLVTYVLNITVPKISSFSLTLLAFVGQVFIGIVIDLIRKNDFSPVTFYGGIIVAAGIAFNMSIEYVQSLRKKARTGEE